MLRTTRMARWCSFTVLVLVALVSTAYADERWVSVNADGNAIVGTVPAAEAPQVSVLGADPEGIIVRIVSSGFGAQTRSVAAGEFLQLRWPGASLSGAIGRPAMPVVRRLFVAPTGAEVSLRVLESEGVTVNLETARLPWRVMPVQPPIEKVPGAIEQAVFQIDQAAYSGASHLATERASVQELGIVRGQRLFMLEVRPVAYDTAFRTLTFYPDLRTQVLFTGGRFVPSSMSTLPGLEAQVLNPEQITTDGDRGDGNYLIIVDSAYETGIAAFAAAKADQGFSVTTHVVDGDSNNAIKSYVESLWGTADAPDYLLLVGDTDTIPHWIGGGAGTPSTDLPYACMDGAGDWYPDIAIGRFPVRTAAQLAAIVDKTLYYEAGVLSDPDYKMRAVFMASTDNHAVSEGTHNWVIDNYMNPLGYLYDKLYTYTHGATTQDTRNSFNDGRFFGVYSGHGGSTSWADGPPFYQTDINNLTNADMYPVVFSFACVTGTYTLSECFTETWIRAENKGAVGIWGSSVNSYWTEDDVLEKRLFDSIFDDGDSVPPRLGPVWNDALMRYLAQMGSGSTTRRYFEMYNLMGDPSLLYLGNETPPTGLKVEPAVGMSAEGPAGGTMAPGTIQYTLINQDEEQLEWRASPLCPWLSVDQATGILPPLGSTVVTVSINEAASNLDNGRYAGDVEFINVSRQVGDTERSFALTVGTPARRFERNLDENPGWSMEGQWQYGVPLGGGGGFLGSPDPTAGATGANALGVNHNGNFPALPAGPFYLTTGPFDLAGDATASVRFQRWLNTHGTPTMSASVEASNDGVTWETVWSATDDVTDDAWSLQEYDISDVAADQSTVYLRWGYGVSEMTVPCSGWNIDDVEVWTVPASIRIDLIMDPEELSWNAVPAAIGYDVVRGDLGTLRSSGGDFTAATEACVADNDGGLTLGHTETPVSPGEGHWILVRAVTEAGPMTYQALAGIQVGMRDEEISAAAATCP